MDGCCERDVAIFLCSFSLHVESASVLIKFPCQYFLEWKTANGKKTAEGRTRPTARNSQVDFNETLELTTEMLMDRSSNVFLRKETLLNLNLISKARQDQVKLIGRVAIDLADLANRTDYARARPFKLSYCSVDAELTFSASMTSKRETNLTTQDLDKSSFNEFLSFRSCASNPKEKPRQDATITDGEDTSIGYGRQPQEHAIDIPSNQRHSRPFNQTFFMFSSPNKTVRRETTIKSPSDPERDSMRSELAGKSLSGNKDAKDINYSRSTQLTNVRIQEEVGMWERDKVRFRGEIDGNREKIEELQRKITELSFNLEDSKRHLQFTEKQNREKEEIIKILKQSEIKPDPRKNEPETPQNMHIKECLELQEKLGRLKKEYDMEDRQWRSKEDAYKGQIAQFQASIDLLRKETEDLRRMWQEKREHFQEKARESDTRVRQRDSKVVQLTSKVEDLLRFKYQYEILKELSEEKDQKLKNTEKSLSKLRFEIEQVNKNNYAEQIYQLKLQLGQSQKAHEELAIKHGKCDEETTRYRESYIKIQTAFELQAKNYENCKEKNLQQEAVIYNLHKDSMELKNSLSNANKTIEELNYKLITANNEQAMKLRAYEDVQRQLKKALLDVQSGLKEKEELKATIDRLRVQLQAKSRDFQDKIRRIESTIIAAHEQKQKQLKEQQQKLTSHIASLQINISSLQSIKQDLQQSGINLAAALSDLKLSSQAELKAKEGLIASLQSVVADKQEINKMSNHQLEAVREANRELTDTLREMNAKEKQLQENIIILEEESHKILYILEQKELLDRELEELQANYKVSSENNQIYVHDIEEERSKSSDRLRIIEEKNSMIVEKDKIIAEKDGILRELQSKLQQLHAKITQYRDGALSLQHELSERDAIIQSQLIQIQTVENQLLQSQSTLQAIKDETADSQNEITKLRNIIRDINERYEDHIKTEQRYQRELDSIRQEKEDLEVYISRNNNEFAIYNEELQVRIAQHQKDIQRLEHELAFANDERKIFDQKCMLLQSEKKELLGYLEVAKTQAHQLKSEKCQLVNVLAEKDKEMEQLRRSCSAGLIRVTELECDVANLHSNLLVTKKESEKVAAKLEEKAQQLQAHQSSLHLMQSQHENLTFHLQNLHEQIESDANNAYNELVELQAGEGEVMAAQSILEERRVVEQEKYDELNLLLCDNEEKVRRLEERIEELNLEIRNLVYQLEKKAEEHEQLQKKQQKGLFEDFTHFHREEMAKIIEQQRREIDRLEAETKMKTSKNSTILENRIRELETNIVELQSSFRMEIDRILNGHANREAEGQLSVINEDNEEDTLRSQKSAAATPNRVKLSMESEIEWKEKAMVLQEQKRQLEGQLQVSQEEKFNLLSTVNQKEIELEEALRMKLMLENERDELKRLNQHAQTHLSSLAAEVESLRNQVNFGTSILLNEQSITRSEPVINQQQNSNEGHFRESQIENLRAQVQRSRAREEELAWNIRDLQMQLETVTQSLNLLNGSSMNSFLNGSGKLSEDEQPPSNLHGQRDAPCVREAGYNKERLLQSLKRNEDLKEMTRGIIRALQQREREAEEQQSLLKDLHSNRAIINSAISNRNTLKLQAISKKIGPICKDFQTVKTLTARENREQGNLRALLGIEQKLKELRTLCEREECMGDY